MNRLYEVQLNSLQRENYSFLTQQFQRMQAQQQQSAAATNGTTMMMESGYHHHQANNPYNNVPASPTYDSTPVVSTHSGEPRPLPDLIAPGRFDVICARGSAAANHVGNLRFREIIRQKLPQYNTAKTKLEKSLIVTSIVDAVRDYTPDGGFIKQDSNGQWYDVGDALAREKIGQCIRDQLHSKYKSSTKAKKQRRKELERKKKELGRITPPNTSASIRDGVATESRCDEHSSSMPAIVTPIRDDANLSPHPESNKANSLAYKVMQAQKEGDALSLMMFAPIGESFVPGARSTSL